MKSLRVEKFTLNQFADLLSVSKETLRRWDNSGKLVAFRSKNNDYRFYTKKHIDHCKQLDLFIPNDENISNYVKPSQRYHSIELFAGAGGMALGFELAGIENIMLNEIDKTACETLNLNRKNWNVIHSDVKEINFKPYKNNVDVVMGGFPCQAFSYAGKKLGFNDARGTLFFEFARAVKEIQPKVCVGENVRGLISHENGKTLRGMMDILDELGYRVIEPKILKAINYHVPQKRERLFIIAIRKDLKVNYEYPKPSRKVYTLKDALKKGNLYNSDVPDSPGQKYPDKKKKILDLVPPGGYWRDLPVELQKEYMLGSFHLSGGKTGMARRIAWDEPSLTLTCAPAQKQTERCHPDETRPFTVREYARIQTFPDDWQFAGSITQAYKQIGNAVPVNLAREVGFSIIRLLNSTLK